jgi:hypothetical protein
MHSNPQRLNLLPGIALIISSTLMLGARAQELPLVDADTISPHPFPAFTPNGSVYQPGESLSYTFQFGLIHAAQADISVTQVSPSQHGPSWEILVEGRTTGAFKWIFKVEDVYRSTIDAASGLPLHFHRDIHEGGYELRQDYAFDWTRNTVHSHRKKGDQDSVIATYLLPQTSHDMVSALYALRNVKWDQIQQGDTTGIPLFMDEEWFELKLVHQGIKPIKVDGKKYECIVIQPVIQTGRIWKKSNDLVVYVTNDSSHIPLYAETRILFGKIRMELTHAEGLRIPNSFGH